MELLIILYACLVLFSQFYQSNQISICHDTVIWDQSPKCCDGARAATIVTKQDLDHFISEMKQRNLSSVWTGLKRKLLKKWTWTDSSTSSERSLQGGTKSARCALLDLNKKTLEPEICSARGHGHICQKIDCQSCSDIGSFSSVCRKIGESCYIYHCDRKNFDMAMASCVSEGGELARPPGNYTVLLGEQIYCKTYWVGLSREKWLPIEDNDRARSESLWEPGEPTEAGNCSFMHRDGMSYKWKTSNCDDQHHVLCKEHAGGLTSSGTTEFILVSMTSPSPDHDTSTQDTGKAFTGTPGWLIGIIVGLVVLVIIVLLVSILVLYRKNREQNGQGIEMVGESEEGVSLLSQGINTRKLRRVLAKSLLKAHRKLELWSFHDEFVKMSIDDIYTDMTWRTSEGIYHKNSDTEYQYTDIFKPDKDGIAPSCVLVQGEAGVGKTTYVKKMLVDWSRGVIGKKFKLKRQTRLSPTFRYMLPIFLRDIRENESLQTIFERQLNLDSCIANKLVNDIDTHSKTMLLILEGYDEFRDIKCQDIQGIQDRTKFKDATLLITCRSPFSSFLTKDTIKFESKVELEGFSEESVKLYIEKYSENNRGMQDGLYEKIISSDDLKGISKIPAILLLMCILWKHRGVLSNNITGFYRDFVAYMCTRYSEKYNRNKNARQNEIIKKFQRELMKLGSIAFQGLKGDKINLLFTGAFIDDIIDKTDQITRRLGFLRKVETTYDDIQYSFHHRTVQEFFTAFYIVNCDENERLNLLMSFCSSQHRHRESKQILRFVAGLGGHGIRYHVEKAMSGWADDASKEKVNFLLTYLDENMDVVFELPTEIEIEMSAYHNASTYTRFFKMPAEHLEELNMYVVHLTVLGYLKFLTAPGLRRLSVCLSTDCPVLSPQREIGGNVQIEELLPTFPLQQLTFKNFKADSARQIVELCKGLGSVETLESLDLSSCELSSESTEALKNALPGLLKKRVLRFGENL